MDEQNSGSGGRAGWTWGVVNDVPFPFAVFDPPASEERSEERREERRDELEYERSEARGAERSDELKGFFYELSSVPERSK